MISYWDVPYDGQNFETVSSLVTIQKGMICFVVMPSTLERLYRIVFSWCGSFFFCEIDEKCVIFPYTGREEILHVMPHFSVQFMTTSGYIVSQ